MIRMARKTEIRDDHAKQASTEPITKYAILTSSLSSDLADQVNRHLAQGWELWGYLLSWDRPSMLGGCDRSYAQVMVRRKKRRKTGRTKDGLENLRSKGHGK